MKLLSSKQELNDSLLGLINNSEKKLIIISPFISFKENNLSEKIKYKKNILEIYTKIDGRTNEEKYNALTAHKKLVANENNLSLIDHLHAKIYINDKTALLSSMNFNDDAYTKSLDFGIITENKEEYNNVIKYCNENIFIYNKKYILDYLLKDIDAEFEGYTGLILKKNNKTFIHCHVGLNSNFKDYIYFYLDLPRNTTANTSFNIIHHISKKHDTEIRRSSIKGLSTKRYYFRLEKKKYPTVSLISIIITSKEKILGILTDAYNCLD
jgi:phosphatidylserine/phosphatidylglycerophosphate/cardiolipin synthase-like enzyme